MASQAQRHDVQLLPELWQRWIGTVDLLTRRRDKAATLDPVEYSALHHALLHTCRQALKEEPADRRPLLERLLAIATPWVSLHALHNADHDILTQTLRRGRQAQFELDANWRRRVVWGHKLLIAAMVLALTALFCAAAVLLWDAWPEWRDTDRWLRATRLRLMQTTLQQRLLAVGAVVAAITGFVVSRSRGSI